MGLLSIFKRNAESVPAAGAEPGDDVARARTRARQRLIGAVVLVVIGIIGFPLVFETQPRPIPVDITIEIPRKEAAAPLQMPAARASESAPAVAAAAPSAAVPPPPAPADDVINETRADAGREVPAPVAAASAAAAPELKSTAAAPVEPAPKPAPKPAVELRSADGARAKALLEGKEPPKTVAVTAAAEPARADASQASSSRFIVQVGAFTDATAAREARLKVERLGLKTYTQVAETPGGSRIRVRVGPFATRDDADRALAKARAAGLGGVVLTL